jgi:hypothetical protein
MVLIDEAALSEHGKLIRCDIGSGSVEKYRLVETSQFFFFFFQGSKLRFYFKSLEPRILIIKERKERLGILNQ